MSGQLPASYAAALADGKVDCTTCHDLKVQCLTERHTERLANRAFLRDGPFRDVSEQCYLCHSKKDFRKLNPHRQLSRRTGVMQEVCLLCHKNVPPEFGTGGPAATFYLDKNLPGICMGCHPVAPHPGFGHPLGKKTVKWTHFVSPSAGIRDTMRRQAAASGIELPLEPATDRVVCSTCHNPHDPTLPGYPATVVSSMGDYKLRRTNICGACHDM